MQHGLTDEHRHLPCSCNKRSACKLCCLFSWPISCLHIVCTGGWAGEAMSQQSPGEVLPFAPLHTCLTSACSTTAVFHCTANAAHAHPGTWAACWRTVHADAVGSHVLPCMFQCTVMLLKLMSGSITCRHSAAQHQIWRRAHPV